MGTLVSTASKNVGNLHYECAMTTDRQFAVLSASRTLLHKPSNPNRTLRDPVIITNKQQSKQANSAARRQLQKSKCAHTHFEKSAFWLSHFPLLCLKYGVEVSKLSIPWLYVTRVVGQWSCRHNRLCSSLFCEQCTAGRLCERNRLEGRA